MDSNKLSQDDLKEFINLNNEKKKLSAELNVVTKRMTELEKPIMDSFETFGCSSLSLEGKTVTLVRSIFAGVDRQEGEDPEEGWKRAIKAVQDAGYDEFVQTRFNTRSLSSLLRQLEKDNEPIPPEFEGAIKVSEKFGLKVTGK